MQGNLHGSEQVQKVCVADEPLGDPHQVIHHLGACRWVSIAMHQSQRRLNDHFAVAIGQELAPMVRWDIHQEATSKETFLTQIAQ